MRRYLRLQRDYALLTLAEKLTLLFTAVAVAAILMALLAVALVFLSIALSAALGSWLGSAVLGYVIVALLYIAIAAVVYAFRKPLIITPIATFLATLVLDRSEAGSNVAKPSDHHEDTPKIKDFRGPCDGGIYMAKPLDSRTK